MVKVRPQQEGRSRWTRDGEIIESVELSNNLSLNLFPSSVVCYVSLTCTILCCRSLNRARMPACSSLRLAHSSPYSPSTLRFSLTRPLHHITYREGKDKTADDAMSKIYRSMECTYTYTYPNIIHACSCGVVPCGPLEFDAGPCRCLHGLSHLGLPLVVLLQQTSLARRHRRL